MTVKRERLRQSYLDSLRLDCSGVPGKISHADLDPLASGETRPQGEATLKGAVYI